MMYDDDDDDDAMVLSSWNLTKEFNIGHRPLVKMSYRLSNP